MNHLSQFILFFAETSVIVIAILVVIVGITAIASKSKDKQKVSIKKLNETYAEIKEKMDNLLLSKAEKKQQKKKEKLKLKKEKKEKRPLIQNKKRIFILNFDGDMQASGVKHLREEISCILTAATPLDEVVVKIESGGGVIHGYGLAASQLQRLKDKRIPLIVCVDKIAASGGYMMACVADKILAAPFAIIGSIGVVAQLPNFHRFLKKHDIDFEQITAGEYKRTLTLFGENTEKGRQKLQSEMEEAHHLFKHFIAQHRPQVDIEYLATGEHWFGQQAIEKRLVDQLITSDDYLLEQLKSADLYEISTKKKKKLTERLTQAGNKVLLNQLDSTDIYYY